MSSEPHTGILNIRPVLLFDFVILSCPNPSYFLPPLDMPHENTKSLMQPTKEHSTEEIKRTIRTLTSD